MEKQGDSMIQGMDGRLIWGGKADTELPIQNVVARRMSCMNRLRCELMSIGNRVRDRVEWVGDGGVSKGCKGG